MSDSHWAEWIAIKNTEYLKNKRAINLATLACIRLWRMKRDGKAAMPRLLIMSNAAFAHATADPERCIIVAYRNLLFGARPSLSTFSYISSHAAVLKSLLWLSWQLSIVWIMQKNITTILERNQRDNYQDSRFFCIRQNCDLLSSLQKDFQGPHWRLIFLTLNLFFFFKL